jgi:ATP-dependent DNA ligase
MAALMKGHTFKKYGHKMTYPAIAEVKVDEIRLDVRKLGDTVLFRSFADKPLHNLYGRFGEAFEHAGFPRLDMGVLVNENFNDTYRYVRSSKGVPDDLLNAKVEFLLFDLPESRAPFHERIKERALVAALLQDRYNLPIMLPVQYRVLSGDDVMPLFQMVHANGQEGLMLKSMSHKYEAGKRSYGWLKVKPEDDADGIIIDIEEAVSLNGEPLGRAGCVVVRCEDGSIGRPSGIGHELGARMWTQPELFIGQWCEFAFMERDRKGGYRHPVFKRIREAKA